MKLKTVLATTIAAVTLAGAASAASVTFVNSDTFVSNGGTYTIIGTNSSEGMGQLSFQWSNGGLGHLGDATPAFAYGDFTTTGETTIRFEDYQPDFVNFASSFAILNLDTNTFVTSMGSCTTNGALSVIDGYTCDRASGQNGDAAARPEGFFYAGLSAGNYRIAVYEPNRPERGQIDFDISAVPLPAGGLLMLGGMGALAAMRRRKKS
ncbi:hypothetical protein OCGS_0579 [Oceaniovalibus guishaninsula JLT2003]|uniref:PEP-CTERM protein-sorting domain-containing protein n=1 Tax=Oceaniovalibus guishaninsula JLT2003 TaxID=1231392 RepID=K2HRZ6_9RHOB|nr:VPLPA-CTERM sorting domain-containing protein [Oceaniovalibus guishaninsula]EKE45489.1 hypothetical protein OCGS_0579 [Oceaniovalibus guishaninsula JLT2003]